MSTVAVPGRWSSDDPSPQLTTIPVTFVELETAKFRLTVATVLAGFGVGVETVIVGGLGG